MGYLGILEDTKLSHVPATVILNDGAAESTQSQQAGRLKHATGKSAHIVLVPQPSEDPNDPLNWSASKKLLYVVIICFGGCLYAATYGPMLNAGLFVIGVELNHPIGDITLISGYQLLVAGSTGALVSAFSRKWGKRPAFLFSSLLGIIGSIIGSASKSYNGLLAARVVQGFSTAAYESLIISMIGDLYFVHERGLYMAAVQMILGCVSNFSAVICGPITTSLGWKYLFHLCVLFSGLQTVLLFLFCPESQYLRDHRYDTDELLNDNISDLADAEKRHATTIESADLAKTETVTSTRQNHRPLIKKTFIQELAIFTGSYTDENIFQLILTPFAVNLNLAVLYVTVVTGTVTATYVAIAYVVAQLFSVPPYLLTATGVGYMFLGPFIGGIIAVAVMSVISDPLIAFCSRRNGGVYEPEYRLLPMAIALLSGVGLMGFGALAEAQKSLYACATMHGLALFGIVAATTSASSYALDAYREMSSEIFVAGIIYKNFLFYGFSYFVNSWTARSGPAEVFYVFGGVAFALVLLTPIVFVFGKKYRSHWARNNVLEKLHLKTHAEF